MELARQCARRCQWYIAVALYVIQCFLALAIKNKASLFAFCKLSVVIFVIESNRMENHNSHNSH